MSSCTTEKAFTRWQVICASLKCSTVITSGSTLRRITNLWALMTMRTQLLLANLFTATTRQSSAGQRKQPGEWSMSDLLEPTNHLTVYWKTNSFRLKLQQLHILLLFGESLELELQLFWSFTLFLLSSKWKS